MLICALSSYTIITEYCPLRVQGRIEISLVDVGWENPNLLPAQMCEILPDQPFRGKLTDEHTAGCSEATEYQWNEYC